MELIFQNETDFNINLRIVAGDEDVVLSFFEHGEPQMPVEANDDAVLILFPGTDLFANGDVEVYELSDEALVALAPAPATFAELVDLENDAFLIGYRNDSDEEVWVHVSAEDETKVTLDANCPPVTILPDESKMLMIAPGREIITNGQITVEVIS